MSVQASRRTESSLPVMAAQGQHPGVAPASFSAGPAGVFEGDVDAFAELGLRNWDRLAAQYQRQSPSPLAPEDHLSPPVVALYESKPAAAARSPKPSSRNTPNTKKRAGAVVQQPAGGTRNGTPKGAKARGVAELQDLSAVDGSAGGFRGLSYAKDLSTGASLGTARQHHGRAGAENVAGNCGDPVPNPRDSDDFARAGAHPHNTVSVEHTFLCCLRNRNSFYLATEHCHIRVVCTRMPHQPTDASGLL